MLNELKSTIRHFFPERDCMTLVPRCSTLQHTPCLRSQLNRSGLCTMKSSFATWISCRLRVYAKNFARR